MGIRASYVDDARAIANAYLDAANRALAKAGLPSYVEPEPLPNVYRGSRFGRSSLDHHSARCIAAVAELASAQGIHGHIDVITANPYRIAFVPIDFPRPLPTDHTERLFEAATPIAIGSSPGLLRDLRRVAPHLGIHLRDGSLDDALAAKLDDMERLSSDDDGSLTDNERTAWLLLHEGARLSIEHEVALSLAG